MLKEDIEFMGPVRLRDKWRNAQQRIVNINPPSGRKPGNSGSGVVEGYSNCLK